MGLFAAQTRGAQSSRATVEAGQPRWWLGMCSGSTSEQPDRLARGTRARDEQARSASRDPVFGGKLQTKSGNPENACGFVEITPGLYHHAKGSCWAHSRGRWERFVNTYGTSQARARPATRFWGVNRGQRAAARCCKWAPSLAKGGIKKEKKKTKTVFTLDNDRANTGLGAPLF